jgi:hypothetical protein
MDEVVGHGGTPVNAVSITVAKGSGKYQTETLRRNNPAIGMTATGFFIKASTNSHTTVIYIAHNPSPTNVRSDISAKTTGD